MEGKHCKAENISFSTFCCIGQALSSLSRNQLSNKTVTLAALEKCSCEEHRLDVFTQTVDILMGHVISKFQLHTCITLESRCEHATTPVNMLFMVILTIMLFIALFGNSIVIVSIIYTRKLRCSPTGMFILSLAFSDLLVALFIVPLKVKMVSHNLLFCESIQLCRMYITIDNILFIASITNLFVLTVDRYMVLQYGFDFAYTKLFTRRRVRFVIVVIWMYAIICGGN